LIPPSTLLFESTDAELGEESELFWDIGDSSHEVTRETPSRARKEVGNDPSVHIPG
jgi:hypothetical protein